MIYPKQYHWDETSQGENVVDDNAKHLRFVRLSCVAGAQ